MKKIIAAFTLLFVTTLSTASHAPFIRKKIVLPEKIQEVEINGDVSIILTNDAPGSVYVDGMPAYTELVTVTTKKGKLTVSDRNKSRFFKITLYIPAGDIHSLTVNGNTTISSAEIIHTDKLLITLNGLSVVKLASAKKGKIKVKAAGEYDLD